MKNLREKLLKELETVALSRPIDCLCWEDGKIELKPFSEISARSRAGIASIERSAGAVRVRFHDKIKALELLLKYGVDDRQGGEESNLLKLLSAGMAETTDYNDILGDDEDHENGVFITEGS